MSAASAAVANHAQDAVDHGAGTDASGADDGRRLSVTRSSIGWDDDVKMAEQIRDMLPYQAEVRRLYNEDASTIGVAILILINFIISAVEKQINPEEGTRAHAVIAGFEIFFAAVFGLELLVNMYAYWFTYFWKSYALRVNLSAHCSADASPVGTRLSVGSEQHGERCVPLDPMAPPSWGRRARPKPP